MLYKAACKPSGRYRDRFNQVSYQNRFKMLEAFRIEFILLHTNGQNYGIRPDQMDETLENILERLC